MPRDYDRTQRVADLIQHELAQLIQRELQDPRLQLVTITHVSVTRDLAYAKIFITQHKADEKIVKTVHILNRAAKHLRYHLAQIIDLRIIPQLKFYHDTSLDESTHLTSLINAAIAADENKQK